MALARANRRLTEREQSFHIELPLTTLEPSSARGAWQSSSRWAARRGLLILDDSRPGEGMTLEYCLVAAWPAAQRRASGHYTYRSVPYESDQQPDE